ncbi:MAG TPA: AMP-binding protein [Gammaproteobacteria bacterium]
MAVNSDNMNLAALLRNNARLYPDKACLITANARISFAELEAGSRRLAACLKQNGVEKGDAAVVFVPFGIELYVTLIALFRLGAVAVLLDPGGGRKYIDACCSLAQPSVFIGTPKAHLLRLLSPALRRVRRALTLNGWAPTAASIRLRRLTTLLDAEDDMRAGGQDPALITFTSGSTGMPKGVCRTHEFLINQHNAIAHALDNAARQIEINTLPVFVLSSIGSGLTVVIPECDLRRPGDIDPGPVVTQIEAQAVNRILGPPAFCHRIAAFLDTSSRQLAGVEKIFTGGGPVFPNLLVLLQRVFPGAEVVAVYGSTEAEPIAHVAYREIGEDDLQRMRGGAGLLAGHPVPEIKLAIIPDCAGQPIGPFQIDEFQRHCLADGQIGEIVVTGEHVLKQYLDGASPGDIKFRVGDGIWHRTGDAGYLDSRGRLWLLGRCQAKIVAKTEIIYPFGVETMALSHTEVVRAAFIRHSNRNVLAIELAVGRHPSDKAVFAPQVLAGLAGVDAVHVVKRIPVDKRHNSKIDYVALAGLLNKLE